MFAGPGLTNVKLLLEVKRAHDSDGRNAIATRLRQEAQHLVLGR